jgi:hypothetical protein
MKIGHDYIAEQTDISLNIHADKILKQAILLVDHLIEIKDLETFKKDFVKYVQDYIKKDPVLKFLDIHELIKLTELQRLQDIYKSSFKPVRSYEIVATNPEQISAYNYSVELCKVLNRHPKIQQLIFVPLLSKENGEFSPDAKVIIQLF